MFSWEWGYAPPSKIPESTPGTRTEPSHRIPVILGATNSRLFKANFHRFLKPLMTRMGAVGYIVRMGAVGLLLVTVVRESYPETTAVLGKCH